MRTDDEECAGGAELAGIKEHRAKKSKVRGKVQGATEKRNKKTNPQI